MAALMSRADMNKPMPIPTRLCYFAFSGLGEPCRFMLAYGNEEFIDDCMTKEQFVERKSRFPFGKVPYLEIDDLYLHQSLAICRYLARKHGIAGNTPQQVVEADVMAETVEDIRAELVKYYWESDPVIKNNKRETVLTNANFYLDKLESAVAYNGGHMVKNQFTWADVVFASMANYLSHMAGSDLFASRPKLAALRDSVLALPNIKKFLQTRTPIPF